MQIDQGFADVNGTRLYYELAGSGQPLVLIHGFTLDTRMWDEQFDRFAQQYQVLRYDVRGFGQSALPTTEPYAHPDDLRALLAHLGIDHAHVIGLSMGGGIAINFAITYPEATATLIPVDAFLPGYQAWLEEPATVTLRAQAKREGVESAKALGLNHAIFVPAFENPKLAVRLKQIIADYSGWHFVNDDPARLPGRPAIDRLNAFSAPTLIVLGERDLPDFHRMADLMAEQMAGAKKVVIPRVGHLSNMEAPERFNEIVLGFLAERRW